MSATGIGHVGTAIRLCVLRQGRADRWAVAPCQDGKGRKHLVTFGEREEAIDYAMQRRQRLLERGSDCVLTFPDDCPCYRETSTGEKKVQSRKIGAKAPKAVGRGSKKKSAKSRR